MVPVPPIRVYFEAEKPPYVQGLVLSGLLRVEQEVSYHQHGQIDKQNIARNHRVHTRSLMLNPSIRQPYEV